MGTGSPKLDSYILEGEIIPGRFAEQMFHFQGQEWNVYITHCFVFPSFMLLGMDLKSGTAASL